MDPERFTAAHRTFPFGTVLRVTDPDNGRSVVVVVNDRGPFIDGRVLDLSYGAAKATDMVQKGVAPVQIAVIQVESKSSGHPLESPARLVPATRRPPKSSPMRSSGKDIVRSRSLDSGRAVGFTIVFGSEEFVYRADAEDLAREFRREGRATVVMQTPFR